MDHFLDSRAEFCLIVFRSFFGQWNFKKKCFWDLLGGIGNVNGMQINNRVFKPGFQNPVFNSQFLTQTDISFSRFSNFKPKNGHSRFTLKCLKLWTLQLKSHFTVVTMEQGSTHTAALLSSAGNLTVLESPVRLGGNSFCAHLRYEFSFFLLSFFSAACKVPLFSQRSITVDLKTWKVTDQVLGI